LTRPAFTPRQVDKSLDDIVQHALQRTGRDLPRAVEYLQSRLGERPFTDASMNAAHQRLLEQAIDYVGAMNPGRMYEVNIHARPEQFLDWDRPLSGQSEAVRSGLQPHVDRWLAGVNNPDPVRRTLPDFARRLQSGEMRGESLVSALGSADRATSALSEAGIPGIRYLDQGSRNMDPRIAAQERHVAWLERQPNIAPERLAEQRQRLEFLRSDEARTSNYVLFNPELIEILRKYGIIAPVAAGAAAQSLPSDQQ
jgi:hypothetical protein